MKKAPSIVRVFYPIGGEVYILEKLPRILFYKCLHNDQANLAVR